MLATLICCANALMVGSDSRNSSDCDKLQRNTHAARRRLIERGYVMIVTKINPYKNSKHDQGINACTQTIYTSGA